ncbi:sigma factor-like helix-turn-helix DNA-binding protein [Bacillus pumilus]|nr:sigma factor-like helix-turn-helix DNA-binding protein [Bacillus pumilus]
MMQAEQELTSEEIARVIGVTSRTIRNRYKSANNIE